MEIYLNLNNKTHKLSLFDDEELTLTKKWDEQQVMSQYGSFSSTFNIPIDQNNVDIFGYYNEIGSIYNNYIIDPNYYISSKIVIDSFEFLGNVQLLGFTEKNGIPYSFQIMFYGDEHDLIKILNGDEDNVMEKIDNIQNIKYKINYNVNNVKLSWNSDKYWFFPLMATNHPFVLNRNTISENNIFPVPYLDDDGVTKYQNTTGVTMDDFIMSIKMSKFLEELFAKKNITHIPSVKITDFLKDMFIMTSTSVKQNGGKSTIVNVYPDIFEYTDSAGNEYSKLIASEVLDSSTDPQWWYGNAYNCPSNTEYNITFSYDIADNLILPDVPGNFPVSFDSMIFSVFDQLGKKLNGISTSKSKHDIINFKLNCISTMELTFCVQLKYKVYDKKYKKYYYYTKVFEQNEINGTLSININDTLTYGFKKSITWPDMLSSDFFLNFCKSFNIFFIYDDFHRRVNTYFKDEIPRNTYDLTDSLIQDKDYAFTHKRLYKKINYKFKEGKDVNNITYKNENAKKNVAFGEFVANEAYDVGIKDITQESIFTIFPNTLINITDNQNVIREKTPLTIHSELNASLSPITTDFLLFYKNDIVEDLNFSYNLQNNSLENAAHFEIMDWCGSYSPYQQRFINTNGEEGYALDYNFINMLDNTTQRYEVTLDFLLELDVVAKLKVYDLVIISNIYYEIKSISTNIKNGYTQLQLVTINVDNIGGQEQIPIVISTTTTTSAPCNPLTINCTPTYFDHGVYSAITFNNLVSLVPSNTPPLTGVSHMYIRNLNISYPAALKYNGSDVYENQKILFNNTLDDLQYSLIYYTNQNNNNTYTDSFDIYFVMDCGAFTNVATKQIIINAAAIPVTTTTTTLPVNTHPPVTLGSGSDQALTLDEENQVLSLDLTGYVTGTTIDKFIDLKDTFNTWPSNHGQMLKVGDSAVEYSTKIGSDATGPWVYVTESHEVTSTNKSVDEMTYTEYYSESGWTYYRGSFTHITGNSYLLYSPALPLKYSEDNYDQTEYMLYVIKESTDPISVYLNGALIRLIDGPDTGYNCPFTVPSDGDYVISFEVSSTDAVVLTNLHIDYYYYTDVYTYAGGLRIVDNTYTSQLNYPNHAGNAGDVCVMDADGLTMTFKSGLDAGLIVKEQLSGLTGGQLLKYYPSTNTFLEVPDNSYKWDKAILKDSFSGGTTGFMYQDSYDNYRIVDLSGFTGDYLSKDDFGDGLMKISGDTTSTIPDNSSHWNTLDTLGQKKFWQGTAAEYAAIATKDANTIYFINVE